MTNLKKHIIDLFESDFIKNVDVTPIVIYGLGEWTRTILEYFPEYPIYGLLDGFIESGEFCGRRILALKDLENTNVKIVIVARKSAELLIYKRISKFCEVNNIPIYNLNGEVLNHKDKTNQTIIKCELEDIYRKLEQYENISFDIFDTLIIRQTIFRELIYQMIGRLKKLNFDFCSIRLEAEKELLNRDIEPALEDIYKVICFKTGITEEKAFELYMLEIKIEKELFIVREDIIHLYNSIVELGKNVYLVTDMYFSKTVVEEILKENDICGYKDVFISSEYGVNKTNGLYAKYIQKSEHGSKAHVGDSKELDGDSPKALGITPFIIPSIVEKINSNKAKGLLLNYEGEYPEYFRCLAFSRMFNDVGLSNDKINIRSLYQLGYSALAPLLYGWVSWIYELTVDNKIDKLLFISRDGYIAERIFQMICQAKGKHIDEQYLKISRTLGWQTSVKNEADILELAKLPFSGSVSEWLKQRFGIYVFDDSHLFGNEKKILDYHDVILEKCELTRDSYQKYLEKCNLYEKKIGIVDFVSSGTCQMCLEKLLDKKLVGLYFEHIWDVKNESTMLISDFVHDLWNKTPNYNYLLLELLIKEPHASIKSIDSEGNFIYSDKIIEERTVVAINEIHRGVLDFVADYIKLQKLGAFDTEISDVIKVSLMLLNDEYVSIDNNIISLFQGFDEFTNRQLSF